MQKFVLTSLKSATFASHSPNASRHVIKLWISTLPEFEKQHTWTHKCLQDVFASRLRSGFGAPGFVRMATVQHKSPWLAALCLAERRVFWQHARGRCLVFPSGSTPASGFIPETTTDHCHRQRMTTASSVPSPSRRPRCLSKKANAFLLWPLSFQFRPLPLFRVATWWTLSGYRGLGSRPPALFLLF